MMATKRLVTPVAIHLFFIQDGQILLLRRFNTGFEDGKYSVVAGHLDGGETVKQAAIREGKEEAGVDIMEENIEMIGVMHRNSDSERIDFFTRIQKWGGTIHNMEPHKCDELRFYPLSNLPNNMIPYIRQAIFNFQEGKWFDSYGW